MSLVQANNATRAAAIGNAQRLAAFQASGGVLAQDFWSITPAEYGLIKAGKKLYVRTSQQVGRYHAISYNYGLHQANELVAQGASLDQVNAILAQRQATGNQGISLADIAKTTAEFALVTGAVIAGGAALQPALGGATTATANAATAAATTTSTATETTTTTSAAAGTATAASGGVVPASTVIDSNSLTGGIINNVLDTGSAIPAGNISGTIISSTVPQGGSVLDTLYTQAQGSLAAVAKSTLGQLSAGVVGAFGPQKQAAPMAAQPGQSGGQGAGLFLVLAVILAVLM